MNSSSILSQNARSLVMVKPVDFGYNPETGLDNSFQHQPQGLSSAEITAEAINEFDDMVNLLRASGIEILVLDKPVNAPALPDAVFPNNWFSISHDRQLFIYPMKTENRRAEVQIEGLLSKLQQTDSQIQQVIDLRQQGITPAMEGTGSLIFHHPSKRVFAAISERCDQQRFVQFAESIGYQAIHCQTRSSDGSPIYHTNVLMSVGDDFAVVCADVICPGEEKTDFLDKLSDTVKDVILISEQQMAEGFCGNILQVSNNKSEPLIVMSASAWPLFSKSQQQILARHGRPVLCHIPTIESIGGGSARCMIAENFSANP